MLNNLLARITIYLLRKKKLSGQARAKVISATLDNIGVLPLRSTIVFDEFGTIKINGKELTPEHAIAFRDSLMAYKDSFARKVIHEQLRFLAIQLGVHQGVTPERIVYGQAALWILEEEAKIIEQLSPE